MIKVDSYGFVVTLICTVILLTSSGCEISLPSTLEESKTPSQPTEEILDITSIFVMTNDRSDHEDQVFRLDKDLNVIESFTNTFGDLTISMNDCGFLNIWGYTKQISILKINFQGEILGENVLKSTEELSPYFQYRHTISPTGDWIAFKEAAGEWGESPASATNQDVSIIPTNPMTSHVPTKVTDRGGAFIDRLAWSPNGQFLEFTDYDENGITQIYLYEPNTQQKIQITKFPEPQGIQEIIWSFDSELLAASTFDRQEVTYGYELTSGKMILASVQPQSVRVINLSEQDVNRLFSWWGNDKRLFIFAASTGQESGTLYWYDATKNVIEEEVKLASLNIQSRVNYAFPLSKDLNLIGIIGGKTYTFDKVKGEYWVIENPTIDYIFSKGFFELIETSTGSFFSQSCR